MNNDLITVTQLPIIEERLQAMSELAKKKVQNATSLVASEDTVKEIKAVRASLNKEFDELETARKNVKNTVMEPYNVFEAKYKELITNVYQPANTELAKKVSSIEGKLKKDKEEIIRRYFNELVAVEKVEWLTYEQLGINITLSVNEKQLKKRVKDLVEEVSSEVIAIEAMPDSAEIMAEYKRTLDMAGAIKTVIDRKHAIEAERQQMADRERQSKADEQHIKQVERYCAPKVPVEEEKIYSVRFAVKGTQAQIRALKEFLNNGGYDYEC